MSPSSGQGSVEAMEGLGRLALKIPGRKQHRQSSRTGGNHQAWSNGLGGSKQLPSRVAANRCAPSS